MRARLRRRRGAATTRRGPPAASRNCAEYLLTLRDQPQPALDVALRNFRVQRDYEDVDILVRTALAAGRPEVLEPVRAWAKAQGVPLPQLDAPDAKSAPP